MRPTVSLPAISTSLAPECRSLNSTTYPGEPDERLAKKRFIMASPADVGEVAAVRPDLSIPEQHVGAKAGEDVNYIAMPKASCQRATYYCISGKLATTSISSTPTASHGPCHRSSGPSPTPLVQPPSISSTALPLISTAKRSRICELYTPSSPFCHF